MSFARLSSEQPPKDEVTGFAKDSVFFPPEADFGTGSEYAAGRIAVSQLVLDAAKPALTSLVRGPPRWPRLLISP